MPPRADLKLTRSHVQTASRHVNACLDGGRAASHFPRLSSLFRSDGSTSAGQGFRSPSEALPLLPRRTDSKPLAAKKPLRPVSAFLPSIAAHFVQPLPSEAPPVMNAFSAMMKATTEDKQWKVAEKSDNTRGRMPAGEKRSVPFYKWVEGMNVTVDAFKYGNISGCTGYFLSHAHSDHYQQLNAAWSYGPIYCSQTTANLIKLKLKVKDQYLKPLPMNETIRLGSLSVTLIDANQ